MQYILRLQRYRFRVSVTSIQQDKLRINLVLIASVLFSRTGKDIKRSRTEIVYLREKINSGRDLLYIEILRCGARCANVTPLIVSDLNKVNQPSVLNKVPRLADS